MDPIHCERRNVVFSIRGDEQGVVIDQLDILLRRKLGDLLIQFVDACKPLRRRICPFRESAWSPWWDGSKHHPDVVLFCVPHHALDVTGSIRQLPSGINVIRTRQNMHRLGLQGVNISSEGRSDLARRLPGDPDIEPIILSEGCLLPGPALGPVKGDGITEKDHRRVNPKTCTTPGGEYKNQQQQESV